MAEHTPIPWHAGTPTHNFYGEQGLFELGDVNLFPPIGNAGPVAIVAGAANASFIVEVVNAHDVFAEQIATLTRKLAMAREALEAGEKLCGAYLNGKGVRNPSWPPYVRKVHETITAALKEITP
jgi:hypothetical protein